VSHNPSVNYCWVSEYFGKGYMGLRTGHGRIREPGKNKMGMKTFQEWIIENQR
jgi:hypothetical protein